MSTSDGQRGNASVLNAAYASRTVDTSTSGKVDLTNPNAESGPDVENLQREVNSLNSFSGRLSGSDFDALPAWVDTSVGTANDNLEERAEALTVFAGALEAEDLTFLKLDGSRPMVGDLDMDSNNIENLADPVNNQDAATKFYVDNAVTGSVNFQTDQNILSNQVFS